jgi:MFS family permease
MNNTSININSTKSITSIIVISVIGPSVFIVQPGFVQGMVELLGFTEQQAGYVAAAEMWGIATTTVMLSFLTGRLNWRLLITISAILMVSGNLASTIFSDPIQFAITRIIVGIGAGTMISLGFTMLGLTANTDRNFGYMIMWVLLYGAIVMIMLPTTFELIGMNGLLIFFALFASLTFFIVPYLPRSAEEHKYLDADNITTPVIFRAMAVMSVFVFFTGIGAIWAYLFLIGINTGSTEQQIANALTACQFMGAAGAFTAAIVANKFGRIKPLTVGILGCLVPMIMLFGVMGLVVYVIAVCVFNYAYNMTHPYLYAALSSIDRTGHIIRYAVAGQMIGAAVGPSIAASVVAPNNFTSVILVSIIFFTLSLVFIIPPLINHKHAVQTKIN